MSKMTRLKLFLSSPFLLLLFLTFNPVKAVGQALPIPPDCVIFVNITVTAGSPATVTIPNSPWFDNRTLQCQTWTIGYQATATSGTITSLSVQAAQATATPLTGAFADWAGTVVTGINPNTSSTGATSTLNTGCVTMMACTTANSYIRVLLTRNNFVGTINGVLYGYRSGYPGGGGSGGSGSGCPGTAATPCVVDGVTAAGSPPTTPPVLVAGQDGAPGNIRTIKTDSGGQPIVNQGTAAAVTAPWPIFGGQPVNATATWTSATGLDTTLAVSTVGYANVTIGFVKTGVITGGTVNFEGSTDGVNWVPVSVVAIGASTSGASTVVLTTGNNIWQMFIGGLTNFRLRLNPAITGAGSAAFTLATTAIGTEFQQVVTQGSGLNLHVNVDALPGATTAQADGQTNSPVQPVATVSGTAIKEPTYPFVFNGATWDRQFSCIFRAVAVTAPGTTNVFITGVMGKTTKICQLHVSDDTTANLTINSGTGTNCGMGTTRIDSYTAITAIAMDFTPWSPLTAANSGDDVCYAFSTSVANVSLVAIYAQY